MYQPQIERYRISVDVYEILDAAMAEFDTSRGSEFFDFIDNATDYRRTVFVMPTAYEPTHEDFSPYRNDDQENGVSVLREGSHEYAVRKELVRLGYMTDADTTRLFSIDSEGSYVDDNGIISSTEVTTGFKAVVVTYFDFPQFVGQGSRYAQSWRVDDTIIVQPGHYIQAEYGEHVYRTRATAFCEPDDAPSAEFLYSMEGMSVSRCDAHCTACETEWTAEGGSWRFRAEDSSPGFDFDDAEDIENDSITCPTGCGGRVHFMVR